MFVSQNTVTVVPESKSKKSAISSTMKLYLRPSISKVQILCNHLRKIVKTNFKTHM